MAGASPQRVLLVASLALNLFFVGIAAAVVLHRPRAPEAGVSADAGASPKVRIDALAATLPPADARVLQDRFGAGARHIDAADAASREAQEKARRALSAVPYDPAAAAAALTDLRAARREVWSILHGVVVEAARDMSQEGRDRLAAWVPPQPAPRQGNAGAK